MKRDEFSEFGDYLAALAAELHRYGHVPDDVLADIVDRDGACMWVYANGEVPEWTGDEMTDRELAAKICANCTARLACLELELRTAGPFTVGVWGALPEQDRRALYPLWRARRESAEGGEPE